MEGDRKRKEGTGEGGRGRKGAGGKTKAVGLTKEF